MKILQRWSITNHTGQTNSQRCCCEMTTKTRNQKVCEVVEECDSPDHPVAPWAPACCPVCGGCCRQAWCCETTAFLQGAGHRIRGCEGGRERERDWVHRIWVCVLGLLFWGHTVDKRKNLLKWWYLRVFNSQERSPENEFGFSVDYT